MIFLPIADRELRVASRKRSTFTVRMTGALITALIGGVFLLMNFVRLFGIPRANLGPVLFGTLSWLGLLVALSSGLFLTSDCLSEEKREGTLGFLFLTDLRGYDIVLGKLLATSLRGLCALLAVFPILAMTLIMGGVTGAQFWKITLALINALFLSLGVGLFVSVISRDSQKAMLITFVSMLLLAVGAPAFDSIVAQTKGRTFEPILSLASPSYLFVSAGAWGRAAFWESFLVNQGCGWILFGLTCFLVPRTWQESSTENRTIKKGWAHWWKFGGDQRRVALRRKLIEVNPVLWLVCRDRWQAATLWIAAIVLVGISVAMLGTATVGPAWVALGSLASLLMLAVYLAVASQASRFFVEAQRSGLLELLLSTPLSARQIIQGQWRGLVRMFSAPLILWLAVQLTVGIFAQQQTWNTAATLAPPPPAVKRVGTNRVVVSNQTVVTTSVGGGSVVVRPGLGFGLPNQFVMFVSSASGIFTVVANLTALIWFGMWMGLTSKSTNLSTLKTILFVQVIPWFVISAVSAMAVPLLIVPKIIGGGGAPGAFMIWFPLLMSLIGTVLYLAKDVAFTWWARGKLYSEFHQCLARIIQPVNVPVPPRLSGAATAPPIIRS